MEEIEIKLAFNDKESVKEKLKSLNPSDIKEETIEDSYHSTESVNLKEAKKFLRIRRKGDFSEVTFKGEVSKDENVWNRTEINCELKDPESMRKILDHLDFNTIRINKTNREYFYFRDIEVVIVEITEPAKVSFLEIEGPSENAVKEFREKLGDVVFDLPKDHFKSLDKA